MGDASRPDASPSCSEMFAKLSEYLDGELPDDVCERFDRHIGDCEPCVRFVESLRRALRLVESDDPIRLPDDVRRDLLESARRLRER